MKGILAALAAAAMLPMTASAADFDYHFADVTFSQAHSSFEEMFYGPSWQGGNGYLLDGSWGLGDHWFVEGAYRHNQFHIGITSSSEATLTPKSLRLGGGYHLPISDHADLVAHLEYGSAKTTESFSGVSATEDDHSYVAGMNLRMQLTDALELDAGLDHDNLGLGEQIVWPCPINRCAPDIELRQGGAENVVSTALRYRFGLLGTGIEYRASNFQSSRELLLSLRFNF